MLDVVDYFKNYLEPVDFKRHTGVRARPHSRLRGCASVGGSLSGRTFIFRRRRSARCALPSERGTLTPYVNYCRYASVSFCFIFSTSPRPSSRYYRKPLNSWSFRGRGHEEQWRGQALSRMNKRGNRARAWCKFITRVCRAFVRVRLFVKSNQILSSAHSRRFYKSFRG